ncbi:MAG: hypothetical protein K2O67_06075, partial [Clostridia bacterium]|nr:hypothetical protein [Clostridia bacterium]
CILSLKKGNNLRMKKISFALISDVFFFTLCAFLIGFTAVRFYTKNVTTALIIAVGGALAIGVIAFFILLSKRRKKMILSLGESEKKSLSLHLSVCTQNAVFKLFLSALDGTYVEGNRLQDENTLYFFNFKLSPISPDDIAEVIKTETNKAKCVFCCEVSPAALSFAEDFSITVVCIAQIYAMLKDKKLLPEKYALGNVKKPSVFKKIKKRFNRKLCPSLFFCGISLLFFSFFTFYPVYYTVFGGILLALSAVSVLIGKPTN